MGRSGTSHNTGPHSRRRRVYPDLVDFTASIKLGAAVAVVPLVFESLAVFSGIGYAVAAVSVCAAVIVLLTGTEWIYSGWRVVGQLISDLKPVDTEAKVPECGK